MLNTFNIIRGPLENFFMAPEKFFPEILDVLLILGPYWNPPGSDTKSQKSLDYSILGCQKFLKHFETMLLCSREICKTLRIMIDTHNIP